jgi:enoyl-CoA hydratase/carnithine racemase
VPEPAVVLERTGRVAEIVLNRPGKLNAMDMRWMRDLVAAVEAVAADPEDIVVVRGAGRAFCAGMDLDMLAEEGMPEEFYPLQERAFSALEALDRVVVAQIHGYCLGGGLQLALACDIRIVSEDAVLGLPAAREGLPPGMATWRLPRFVGLGRALRLAIKGERIGAAEAERIGLADHLIGAEDFAAGAGRLVQDYLELPQAAARATKRMVRSAFDDDFASAFERSRALVLECLRTAEAAEARAAWAARRR